MKRMLKYIIASSLLLMFSGCNDWLDVQPKSKIRSDIQFETEGGFKDALIGVYLGLTEDALYAKDLTWHFVDILAQQYPLHSLSTNIGIKNYEYTSTTVMPRIENIWLKAYNAIANINNELEYLEKKKSILDPINYAIIKGELLGLRAYVHFDLIRLFGYGNVAGREEVLSKETIPYVTEYTKDITPQLTYAQTFKLMEQDLTDALALLKEDPVYDTERPEDYYHVVNSDGFYDKRSMRMNYYAVRGLMARMMLWQGKKKEALEAAVEVIEHAPYSWVSQAAVSNPTLKDRDMIFVDEHLFTLNVIKLGDLINSYLDPTINNNYELLYQSKTVADGIYEINNGVGVSDYRYMYLYDISGTNYVTAKLIQRDYYNDKYSKRIPLMKISEMYYIAAECLLNGETKDLGKAREYMNTVREKRGIIIPIPEGADEATLETEIQKEYRKEFTCEGQLFYYYKRKMISPIPGTSITLTDKNTMLPYPDVEIDFGQREQ